MTAQDSQRLRGATGNVGLEPEDLGLNFTVTTSLSISSFVHHLEPQMQMTTDSSVLAWRIPGTGEPGGLPSMGLHRVGHD